MKTILFTLAVLSCIIVSFSAGQQTLTEPSTGKSFPRQETIKFGGKEYALSVTGVAVRKKYFFKVYGIAHYIQAPGSFKTEDEAFTAIMADGKAKEIIMDFARDVDASKIKEAYLDGFKGHTSNEQLKKLDSSIIHFLTFFTNDLKENDRIILRWLPGGIVATTIQNSEMPPITDISFAQVLWSIWFGKDSIVDRDKLVKEIVQK